MYEFIEHQEEVFTPLSSRPSDSLIASIWMHDSARKMQSVCSDAGSFDITAPFLGGCIEEANDAYVVAVKRQENTAHGQASILSFGVHVIVNVESQFQQQLSMEHQQHTAHETAISFSHIFPSTTVDA